METTAPTETDYAWAAGFIDGEGCFMISHLKGQNTFTAILEAGQTRPEPLLELRRILGGVVKSHTHATERHAASQKWQIMGANAAIAIQKLLPYLKLKTPQAQLMLEFQSGVAQRGMSRSTSPEETARRLALKTQLSVLNRKGPPIL